MTKGTETRERIVEYAQQIATRDGLEGLSIGSLATDLSLSKSGLFAHFGSKEALEVAVVEEAARQFVQEVMVPALRQPRGEPRIRALFERWLAWGARPGGCFFVGATAELDDRPGPPRDALVQTCKDWIDALATAVRIAVAEGHLRAEVEPDQVAFELYGIMMGSHTFSRFLRDPAAPERTRRAFERLLAAHRAPGHRARSTS